MDSTTTAQIIIRLPDMASEIAKNVCSVDVESRIKLILILAFAEFSASGALKMSGSPIAFYCISILAATVIFLAGMLFRTTAVVSDIREICLYDVLVQVFGLFSFVYKLPLVYFLTLAQAVWILKVVRTLYGIQQADPSAQFPWPAFGMIGWLRKMMFRDKSPYSYRQTVHIYCLIFAAIPLGYCFLRIALLWPFPTTTVATTLAAVIYAHPILQRFKQADAEQLAYLREKELLAAQLAAQKRQLTEQNAELAAFSEERAQHARAVAERNAHLRHASHDLANRMMSAQATMRRAQALAADDEQRACLLELQAQQAQFLEALNGIIAQARVDAPLALPEIQAVACSTIKDNIWEATSELAAQHGTVLHVSVPDWPILTDAMQLERIVYNLLGNAIRHNPPGTHVGLTMRRHSQGCQIRVWDNGSGIAGMHGRNWSDNFTRFAFLCMAKAHRSDDAASHGVGIQSVAQLCAGLDISMTMYSRIGRGTVFRFCVPLGQ